MIKNILSVKRIIGVVALVLILVCGASPFGRDMRIEAAKLLISTRFQQETWILIGKEKRDQLISEIYDTYRY